MAASGSRPDGVTDAERLVDEVQHTKEALRAEARSKLGVTGKRADAPAMREVLARYELSAYPLAALGILAIVDTFQSYAFYVLTPEISRALGVGKGAIAAVIALNTLAVALAPLPMAALAQRRISRALLCVVTGLLWSLVAITTGFVTAIWGLAFVLVVDGLTTGSVRALHLPLLVDTYPPDVRVRAVSYWQATDAFGNVLAPLLVAFLVTYADLTWRGVFVALGLTSLAAAVLALRLRDPGYGRWDTQRIREAVHDRHGEPGFAGRVSDDDVTLGFFEIVRRLLLVPTVRRLLLGYAVFGILLVPYRTFLFFFLEERWGLGPGQRGVFFAFLAALAIVSLALFGKRGERLFAQSPVRVMEVGSAFLAASVVAICLAGLSPWFWVMVALFGLASALLAVVAPAVNVVLLSLIPARMRPHAVALAGIFLGGVGGVLGALFLSGIDRRYGVAGSMVSLLVPGVSAALILRSTGKLVPGDLDRMIDEVVEDEEVRRITAAGGHLPMLACRHVDFSYGSVQVLFDVDFTVDDGEMVALLGVNGAGKSTLMRVISGVGLPTGGSVRFRGADITYLDAERRARLGITQVPGGRAVFGPVSVVDNLRAFGYALGRDRRAVDEALERSFEAFPRLAERRHQHAGTLSGGEQQMLGLARALVLRPRLLLIDELSLGLAPVIVGRLLDMVRRINADGTAVVLVEQSVNIALGLVDHAYFMEKGEVRFDGPSDELLARADLLRAVFLEGAGGR